VVQNADLSAPLQQDIYVTAREAFLDWHRKKSTVVQVGPISIA
jgi:hypothetical protein